MRIVIAIFAALWASGVFAANPITPDAVLTPGATDPAVTQANIHSTICVHGYTARVRHVTAAMKRSVFIAYKIKDVPHGFEVDHLISLELGGSNSLKNLWPESYAGHFGARTKDRLENKLHRMVCAESITLAKAQHEISTDWLAAYKRYVSVK